MVYPNRISDPTPKEIKERCLKIQEVWSEETRFRRLTQGQSRGKTFSARLSGKYCMEEFGYADPTM